MRYPEPTVGAIILNPDKEILLCKSHKWNNKYVIPGGHIELGEKMESALKRELLEETGLKVYDIQLLSIMESVFDQSFHEKKHFIFIDYLCKTNSYDVKLNDEAEEYQWVHLDNIDNYKLGGAVKKLLMELKNKNSKYKTEIFYNY